MQLVVGRIGRAHGIRGEVTVEVRTDEPELRLGPGAVLATDPASAGPLTIESGRVHSGRLLLRFTGVGDRTAAEALRNILLIAEVDPEETPEDPEEFYDHQLMDLEVVTTDGTVVGRISEISHLPSQDLFIVERPDGSEVMIPFVSEIVTEIDLDEQRAVVDPPRGLIDTDEAEIASAREAVHEAAHEAGQGPEAEPGQDSGAGTAQDAAHGSEQASAQDSEQGSGRGSERGDA
ncbi:ribosome maturation factor RimM [Streptomyces nondiastaticus]|uniref:Ribosome maturation factor RimM n=1 Tax=Streptomyces nondiastaticus TaxID=3154512 RepID=A0ABW6TZP7_9ACTN